MLLEAKGLSSGYGRKMVVKDINLAVQMGEIVLILGHNGAGKSTLLKTIMGGLRPSSGIISFDGCDITHNRPSENVALGIACVLQTGNIFPGMNVSENLEIAKGKITDKNVGKRRLQEVFDLFPILHGRRNRKANVLSGGERQMLAIGIGLMLLPRLLLLDEPSCGLAPLLVQEVFRTISHIKQELHVSILLVEQSIDKASEVANRVYVMRWSTGL